MKSVHTTQLTDLEWDKQYSRTSIIRSPIKAGDRANRVTANQGSTVLTKSGPTGIYPALKSQDQLMEWDKPSIVKVQAHNPIDGIYLPRSNMLPQ